MKFCEIYRTFDEMFRKVNHCSKSILDDFRQFQNFPKNAYPVVKFDEKRDGEIPGRVQLTVLEIRPNFWAKMGPREIKNGTSLILTAESISATLKTPLCAVSSKSNKFDKMAENQHSYSKAILNDFRWF